MLNTVKLTHPTELLDHSLPQHNTEYKFFDIAAFVVIGTTNLQKVTELKLAFSPYAYVVASNSLPSLLKKPADEYGVTCSENVTSKSSNLSSLFYRYSTEIKVDLACRLGILTQEERGYLNSLGSSEEIKKRSLEIVGGERREWLINIIDKIPIYLVCDDTLTTFHGRSDKGSQSISFGLVYDLINNKKGDPLLSGLNETIKRVLDLNSSLAGRKILIDANECFPGVWAAPIFTGMKGVQNLVKALKDLRVDRFYVESNLNISYLDQNRKFIT
jgi:hypothetical protein